MARRKRLADATWVICLAWWAILMVVGIGAHWWEPVAHLKHTTLGGVLTIDRLLALGAAVSVVIAISGRWLTRNLRRPPQLFILLRDFQSSTVAQLASAYVHRHGAAWGYWLTLENADLQAANSIAGEVETDPDDERDRNQKPPVGAWWATSITLGLVLATMLVLHLFDSTLLQWMRLTSGHYGMTGRIMFGVVAIMGIATIWLSATLIIRWVLRKVQRAVFLPGRINTAETYQNVFDTIISRVRRRATTLTLGPMPVISVDNAWWQDTVLHCIAEARLVVFMVTARKSAALDWEMDQVRHRFDPRRTLYIELDGHDLYFTDGTGDPIPGTSLGREVDRIDAAVRRMLLGD